MLRARGIWAYGAWWLTILTLALWLAIGGPVRADSTALNCAAPTPAQEAACAQQATAILATTARLELYGPWTIGPNPQRFRVTGHGTVIDGRYIVTHNHYQPLALIEGDAGTSAETIELYAADGIAIGRWLRETVAIIRIDAQTLLFDFGPGGGGGALAEAGFQSAALGAADGLRPGTPVAQIDWDVSTARIHWTTIVRFEKTEGVRTIILDGCITVGASGGGIFANGRHIANTWRRSVECRLTGGAAQHFSRAALNHPVLLRLIND